MNWNRSLAVLLWTLAFVLPGGFPMLALWYSLRAAREKPLLDGARTSVVPPTPAIQG